MSAAVPYARLAAFYFFYFASLGALLPYWSLYLRDLGLKPLQIGTVMALLSATKVAAPNLLGWIADHTGRRIPWVRVACLLAATFFLPFLYLRDYPKLLAATLAFGFCWSAALSQFEAVTLAHLHDRIDRYPWVRLWGSVGFIVAVLALGMGLDRYGTGLLPRVVAGILGLIWLSTQVVPEPPPPLQAHHEPWGRLLWRLKVLAFLAVIFLIQVAHGPYYVFYSLHLQAHGCSGALIGGLWTLGVIAEIALFLIFPWLLRRLPLRGLWLASIALGALRWHLIGHYPDDLAVLAAAQTLHAATFAVNHAVAMQLLRQFFGPRHQGKGQALYSSLSFGLGSMTGSYLAGLYWQSWGAAWVFDAAAGVSLLACLIALPVRTR
ncbi:MFS transporter, PPP family, 3-phenylpropionic acid transporter [Methylomarinovum caldicuralii]|uniref:MFS transporter, PPP family, 3-phenylpropionic acid transporter n=1 Tax=Methylomarinovum caldicuralii TaxID=438856 RepID=A0AAU9C4F0_9GAMM|nr:MFS transporter [Methylomarinovum caldicuralii]BCX82059.1 MFS transporter, PPP family, 3-phenylpropionic acid transporter [Methylomarinovum caldicuralii]